MIPFNPLYNVAVSTFAAVLTVAALIALAVSKKYWRQLSTGYKALSIFAIMSLGYVTGRLLVTESSIKHGRTYEVTPTEGVWGSTSILDETQYLELDRQAPGELAIACLAGVIVAVCLVVRYAHKTQRLLMFTTATLSLLGLLTTVNATFALSYDVDAPQWSTSTVFDGMLRDLLLVAIVAYVLHAAYCGFMIARNRVKMNAQRQMLVTPAKTEVVPAQRSPRD